MTKAVVPCVVLVAVASCGPREAGRPAAVHEAVEIPIDLNTLSDEQRSLISTGNEIDTTPYLMQSRPIVCQIVKTGNDADEVRYAGPITERAEVMIYALGEADGERLVDYGWLENVTAGTVVWRMTFENSEYGGGDPRNRRAVETLWLDPGRYELHYVSNGEHAFGDWRGAPPERELFYGVVVFNIAAIRSIEERFREAGIDTE